jgi:hypothetical protein
LTTAPGETTHWTGRVMAKVARASLTVEREVPVVIAAAARSHQGADFSPIASGFVRAAVQSGLTRRRSPSDKWRDQAGT